MSDLERIIVDGTTFRHVRQVSRPLAEPTGDLLYDDCVTSWDGRGVLQPCTCGRFTIRWESVFKEHVRRFS